jgi:hypothetical protein
MATATYPRRRGVLLRRLKLTSLFQKSGVTKFIAAYQKNLKMAPLVKKIAMSGKKGDKLHIPKPVRADANSKNC